MAGALGMDGALARRLARWLAALAMVLLAAGAAQAQDLQPVPALTGRVVDTVNLLDAGARNRIEAQLAALERDKGSQVVFLLVATTAPEDIASYANRVANTWKIGRRDVGDGLLLVMARDDRRVRIEVAKTLEGAIPDLAAKGIIDEAITPAFRRGDYAGGLEAGAARIAALVRGEPLPAPPQGPSRGGDGTDWTDLAIFLFVAVPVLATVLRNVFGRKLGSLATAGGVGLIAWSFTASVLLAGVAAVVGLVLALVGGSSLGRSLGRHGGRWGPPGGGWSAGAGGWSGGGWGGGGGGGGFGSGGGGDFGGGGASGDW